MEHLDQLRAALSAEFNDTLEGLRGQINALQQETASLRQELQVQSRLHEAYQSQPRSNSRPKHSLPDPEKFNGSSWKFDTWDAAIRAKLAIDGQAIGDATAQFYYVYLNLDSKVQAMVLPQLAYAKTSGNHDYNTILDQLTRVYDNPNKVQEAEDRLLNLKQDTDPLAAYIAKFERNLYEAHGHEWPDVAKISAFRKGLNSNIRNRLNQQLNLPRVYPDFLRVVQQLASYSGSSGANTTQKPSAPRNDDRMEIGTIGFLQRAKAQDSDSD